MKKQLTRTELFEKFLVARARFERDLANKSPDLHRSAQFASSFHKKYLATFN